MNCETCGEEDKFTQAGHPECRECCGLDACDHCDGPVLRNNAEVCDDCLDNRACPCCQGTGIGQFGDPDRSKCSTCGGSGNDWKPTRSGWLGRVS